MKYTNQSPSLILASASSSRKQQLEDLGFVFTVKPSGINEDLYKKNKNLSLEKRCQAIAHAKVEKVAQEHPDSLTIGGDQMAVLGSEIFNKSETEEQAIQSLMKLQGKTHYLFTALYMKYKDQSFNYLETNKMTMRKLNKIQIKKYVEKAHPLHCAGSYALERYGISLFEQIETRDQSAIIGFPLITLINQMIKWNIPLPFL